MEKQMKKRVLSIALAFSIVFTMAGVVTVGIDLANKNAKTLEQNRTSTTVDGNQYVTVGQLTYSDFEHGTGDPLDFLGANNEGSADDKWVSTTQIPVPTANITNPISGLASMQIVHTATANTNQLRKSISKGLKSAIVKDAIAIIVKIKTEKDIVVQPAILPCSGPLGYKSFSMEKFTVKGSPDVQEIVVPLDESLYVNPEKGKLSDNNFVLGTTGGYLQFVFPISSELTGDATNTILLDDFRQVKEAEKVTVTAAADGNGTVTGTKEVYAGTSCTLTATPSAGYMLDGWYKGTEKVGTEKNLVIVATTAETYTAKFVEKPSAYDVVKPIVNGDIEAENCVGNTNGSDGLTNENELGKLGWAKNINTDEGGSTNTIVRDTTSPITGNASLKFASSGVMSYGCQVFKRIDGPTTKFDATTTAVRFKIKTSKNVQLQFGIYDYKTAFNASKVINISGNAEVQTIVIPLNQVKTPAGVGAETLPTTFTGERRFSMWFAGSDSTGHDVYVDDFEEVKDGEGATATITTATSGTGTGTVSGGATAGIGDDITLTATPADTSAFAGWFDGDTLLSKANPYEFILRESKTITAKFSLKPIPDPLANWIKAADVPFGDVEDANSVLLNSTANNTDRREWGVQSLNDALRTTDANKKINGTASVLVKAAASNKALRKQFSPGGSNNLGIVSDAQGIRVMVQSDNDATIKFQFVDITADGNGTKNYTATKTIVGSPEPQQITIPFSECVFSADATKGLTDFSHYYTLVIGTTSTSDVVYDDMTFVKAPLIERTITVAASDTNGTVAIAEEGPFFDGDIVTISAEPKEGYALDGWYLNDEKVYEDTVIEVTVNGDANYIAKFKVAEDPIEPEVPEGEKGFTPAVELKEDAFTAPTVGSIVLDPTVELFESASMKWSYDFSGDSATEFKNSTTVANVKLNSNAFGILTKTANDVILNVKLTDGSKEVTFEQKIIGNAEEQLISFDLSDIIFNGTNAVFEELNKAKTSMTLTLKKPATTSRAVVNAGTLNFNNISDINYQKMVQKEEEIEDNPTYTVKVSSDGNGTVTGGGSFENGTNIEIVATPNAGYKFGGWYLNGTKVSTKASYSLNVEGDAEYIAKFTKTSGGSGSDDENNDDINGGNGTNGDGTNAPQTGDVTPLILLISLITATGLLVTIVVIAKKKGQK